MFLGVNPLLSVFFVGGDSRVLPLLLLLFEVLLVVEIVTSLDVRPTGWPDTETDTATGVKLPRLCQSDFREGTLSLEKVAFRDETPEAELLPWEGPAEKGHTPRFGKNCEKQDGKALSKRPIVIRNRRLQRSPVSDL